MTLLAGLTRGIPCRESSAYGYGAGNSNSRARSRPFMLHTAGKPVPVRGLASPPAYARGYLSKIRGRRRARRARRLVTVQYTALLEQLQDGSGLLVRLGEHRARRLDEYAVLGVLDHLGGHVGIADAALGGLEVLRADVDAAYGVLEPVLIGSEVGALLVDLLQCLVEDAYGPVGAVG